MWQCTFYYITGSLSIATLTIRASKTECVYPNMANRELTSTNDRNAISSTDGGQ